jgi:hypothetical protein
MDSQSVSAETRSFRPLGGMKGRAPRTAAIHSYVTYVDSAPA